MKRLCPYCNKMLNENESICEICKKYNNKKNNSIIIYTLVGIGIFNIIYNL